jgi:hypothetical protein
MSLMTWTACALALGLATLGGCHPSNPVTYGTGVVTMYDAGGDTDFVSYIVSIDSITLTRTDGLVIEPFATPEIIDLAKLHDLTELVENPAIPIGTYTSLSLLLDYTAPDITVNVNGVVTAASPVDNTGAAITTISLTVNFDPNNPLVINALECARLAIDLNLAASNTVNFSASPLTVTVQPMITATPAAEDSTVMRARGILVVTQPDSSNYIVNMRPFQDLVSALGALTVSTSATTYFNIDGVTYTGAAGLAAMNDLQVSTPVAAYGTLGSFSTITPGFNATAVYAGTSLESPLADYITGVVSARSGDTLTIHGANWLSSLGVLQSYAELPVTVDSATVVSEDGVAASGLSPQSISVGQLINVSGVSTLNSSDVVTLLDASSAQVRLQPTPIWGTLNSGAAGSMSLDLLSIGDFQPSVFSFAGTGSSAANDAVATAYAVDTGKLNESGTAAGTLLQAIGVVAPFGAAPPDFTTTAVTAGTALPQQLVVEWESGGTTAPFSSASSAGLVVNLANPNLSSTIRYIATGPARTDLKTLPASPTIVFASGTPLTLAINSALTISVFNHVTSFATALASTLNGTNEVYRLVCVGQYSATGNTFTATQVSLNLEP